MIHQALLVVFCFAETIGATTKGRIYDREKESRALATRTNRFDLDKPRQGRMPVDCLNKCDDPTCRGVNVFINGTCEVLLSPVFSVEFFAESTAYIGSYETCPDGFGEPLLTRAHASCYKFALDEERTWNDARDHCVRQGGDLVGVETRDEMDHLESVIKSNTTLLNKWFWSLGIDEDKEGLWRWVSTEAPQDGSLPVDNNVTVGNTLNCICISSSTPSSCLGDAGCTVSAFPLCEVALS